MKVSKTGYKKTSKVKNEKSLIVPSGWITMTENDGKPLEKGPILGIDNLGNMTRMEPGLDYSFPGDYVYEIPIGKAKNGGYILPGRYRNPEGNWLNKYAGGGDISIPDLSRPNWLDKAQKGLQYTGEPTRADSLDLLKNSRMVLDYYNSKNYIADPPRYLKNAPEKDSFMDETMSAHKMYDPTVKQQTSTGLRSVPLNEYYQPVDNNKFYQRELAYGILDTNSPMVLYDRRIQPTTIRQYGNNDLSSPIVGDIAVMGMYDPLSITPWDMLTDAQKKLRVKRFGRDGVPENYNPDRPSVPKNLPYKNVQLLQQPEDRLVREYNTIVPNEDYRRVYDKSPYSIKEYGQQGKPTHWAKEDEKIPGVWRPINDTPSDLFVSKRVKFNTGGWLEQYQDGSEVVQQGPELNQVNIVGEKPGILKQAWNKFERSKYNPMNLFLEDMTSLSGEESAFNTARNMGMPEYMYKGKRYSTKMDWLTPQEQLEQTGITDDQLHRRGFFEKRLSNNLDPIGYGMGDQSQFDRFWNAAIKNEKDPNKAVRDLGIEDPDAGPVYSNNRTDAYNLYTGLPQKYNTFSISKYKPSRAKDSDVIYYSINDLADDKDFKTHVVDVYNVYKANIDDIVKQRNLSDDKLDYLKKRYDIGSDRARINEGLNPGEGLNDQNLGYIFNKAFYNDSDLSRNDTEKLKAFLKDIGEIDLANNINSVIQESRKQGSSSPYSSQITDIYNIISALTDYDPKTKSYGLTDYAAGVMGNYNLSKGVDPETGREYLSYRDKWDIDPVDFGKPFEIYDRIYFDDPDLIVPKQKHGGSHNWLNKYQDGSQVAPNLPRYNPEIGPTIKNAELLKEERLREAVRNSQSLNLPSGSIQPTLGPIEYMLLPGLAGSVIKKAMEPKAPVDTELEAIRKILRKNVTYPKQTGPLTETPPWPNRFLELGDDAWVIGNMESGRTSVENPDIYLPGNLPKRTPKQLPGVNGTQYPNRPPKQKNGGVKSSGEGYYDYINGYSGIFAKGGPKGWLDNYK